MTKTLFITKKQSKLLERLSKIMTDIDNERYESEEFDQFASCIDFSRSYLDIAHDASNLAKTRSMEVEVYSIHTKKV